jgi:hypothetical protein
MTANLVIDFETTDLHPQRLTILEAAWCVVDPAGRQRTPIRQRYTAICSSDAAIVPDRQGAGHRRWTGDRNRHNPQALEMAVNSGLYDDWLACPRRRIITDAVELQRLILDDLEATVDPGKPNPAAQRPFQIVIPGTEAPPPWLVEPERAHVAGMGTAQFDQPVMRLLFPQVVADFGRSGPTHYRPADVSVTQQVLLGHTKEFELISWAAREWDDFNRMTLLEWSKPPLCEYDLPPGLGLDADDKPHRAALDVARAIVIQRILWRFGAPLRAALGLGEPAA